MTTISTTIVKMFNEKKGRQGETQITLNYFDFHSPFQSNFFLIKKNLTPLDDQTHGTCVVFTLQISLMCPPYTL